MCSACAGGMTQRCFLSSQTETAGAGKPGRRRRPREWPRRPPVPRARSTPSRRNGGRSASGSGTLRHPPGCIRSRRRNGHLLARKPRLLPEDAAGATLTGQAVADGDAQRLAVDRGHQLAATAGGKAIQHGRSVGGAGNHALARQCGAGRDRLQLDARPPRDAAQARSTVEPYRKAPCSQAVREAHGDTGQPSLQCQ